MFSWHKIMIPFCPIVRGYNSTADADVAAAATDVRVEL